ncbi:MAG TPA: hypothetical protein VHG30_01790, partial [Microvirga sp.]|nr:hypothetical protein [Microvirga sp.]
MPENRLTELLDAIRGKNVLEAPQVERIDPEIRTAMKFYGVKKENFGEAVDSRGGVVPAVVVMWYYAVEDRDAFLDLLRTVEPDLAKTALTGATYLGTYMRFISEIEPSNQFMTQWGCRGLADIANIG